MESGVGRARVTDGHPDVGVAVSTESNMSTESNKSTEARGSTEANKERVRAFWTALYERDWDAIGRFFGLRASTRTFPLRPTTWPVDPMRSWPGSGWGSSGSPGTTMRCV